MRVALRSALAAVLIAATAASADTGAEAARTRTVARDYSRCVVKKHGDAASAAIMSDSGNGDIERHYAGLMDSDCLGMVAGSVQLRFGGDQFRYALADALVRARLAGQPADSFADRLPLAHLPSPAPGTLDAALAKVKTKREQDEVRKQYERAVVTAWMSRYGECVVRREPEKARRWLLTEPDQPEEISRINDLRPAFAECFTDGTMTFNRTTMRGAVAINYYRLAMATRVPMGAQ